MIPSLLKKMMMDYIQHRSRSPLVMETMGIGILSMVRERTKDTACSSSQDFDFLETKFQVRNHLIIQIRYIQTRQQRKNYQKRHQLELEKNSRLAEAQYLIS